MTLQANPLTPEVKQAFLDLYDYRLILVERFYQRYLTQRIESYATFVTDVLPRWIEAGWVELMDYGTAYGLVLGKQGIEIVKEIRGIPDNVLDEKGNIRWRYHYKSSELKPTKNKLKKYIAYSEYIFELMAHLDQLGLTYRYYDRLHAKEHMRFGESDGVLVIEEEIEFHLHWNVDYPLSAKRQCQRGYQPFFELNPTYENERPVYAIFLHQEDFGWLAYRHAHFETLEPYLSRSFNALSLTPAEFKVWIQTHLLPKLNLTDPLMNTLKYVSDRDSYLLSNNYRVSPKEIQGYHTRFTLPDGRYLFVIDGRDFSSSALKQMRWHGNNRYILRQLHHPIKHEAFAMVVVDDVEKLEEFLYQEELYGEPYLFFTTLEQLKQQPLLDACWRYNVAGVKLPMRNSSRN